MLNIPLPAGVISERRFFELAAFRKPAAGSKQEAVAVKTHACEQKMIGPKTGDFLSDGQLLQRYLARRDEAAFATLVQRYAGLVLGVCRRVLRDGHAAEDAFQATFLVLVRRAASLDKTGSLSSWLYGVAYRTALKARGKETRQRIRDRQAVRSAAVQANGERVWSDLQPVLDEELHRLPSKYRLPLVLCYLEGKTHQQAARELGWPSGSMSRRVERAREILRGHLEKRGLLLSTGILFALIGKQQTVAAGELVVRTAQAAMHFGAGSSTRAAAISPGVAALAEKILLTFSVSKLKISVIAGVALLLGLVGLFGGSGKSAGFFALNLQLSDHQAGLCASSQLLTESTSVVTLNWKLRHTFPTPGEAVQAVAFSPDGATVAVGGQSNVIHLRDVAQGKERGNLRGHEGMIAALAFAPQARTLASASHDQTVRLWDLATGRGAAVLRGHRAEVLSAAFANDGRTLVSAGADETIRLWDRATGHELASWTNTPGPVVTVACAPARNIVASAGADGSLILWDRANGSQLKRLSGHRGGVHSVAFSSDGQFLASGGADGTVRLWDQAGKPVAVLAGHEGAVNALAFLRQSEMLVSASADHTLRVWDVKTRACQAILKGHTSAVLAVACAANDLTIASGSSDGTARIWQAELRTTTTP